MRVKNPTRRYVVTLELEELTPWTINVADTKEDIKRALDEYFEPDARANKVAVKPDGIR